MAAATAARAEPEERPVRLQRQLQPHGTRLAISQDATDVPRLTDQTTNEAITQVYGIPDEAPVTPVLSGGLPSWSPYGRYLATTTGAGNVDLWNAGAGTLHLQLRGQVQLAGPAVFSSDSTVGGDEILQYVATGSASGSAAVWNATSGLQLATLSGQPGQATPAAFSGDATELLTFGNDGSARTWSTGIVTPRPIGNAALRARLNAEQLRAYEQPSSPPCRAIRQPGWWRSATALAMAPSRSST